MERISRSIKDKATNAPVTGAAVFARPVTATGSGADIQLFETPPGSGFYLSENEEEHGTFKILVNGIDSLDEVTTESGRKRVRNRALQDDFFPLIDKCGIGKIHTYEVVEDNASIDLNTMSSLVSAASSAGNPVRTIVLDCDMVLSAVQYPATNLVIDLNGNKLKINSGIYIDAGTNCVTVMNGTLELSTVGSNLPISGSSVTFVSVKFIGSTSSLQKITEGGSSVSIIGCTGLPSLAYAGGSGQTAHVVGGSHSFATADQIKLTDPGSDVGSGRLTKLQDLIDTWRDWLVTWKSAVEWLTTSKRDSLDAWAAISPSVQVPTRVVQLVARPQTATFEMQAGVKLGLNLVTPQGFSSPYLSGCMKFSAYSNGIAGFQSFINKSTEFTSFGTSLSKAYWDSLMPTNLTASSIKAFVIDDNGQRKNVKFVQTSESYGFSVWPSSVTGFFVIAIPSSLFIDGVEDLNAQFYLEFDLVKDESNTKNYPISSR